MNIDSIKKFWVTLIKDTWMLKATLFWSIILMLMWMLVFGAKSGLFFFASLWTWYPLNYWMTSYRKIP